ncbi:MAG: hypothetical protein D6688_06745 [Alphaproteobacteria bacterium]|nr:MAG: hypothetical protein D6688_06745 [Alphaproteobacteria bacterium]
MYQCFCNRQFVRVVPFPIPNLSVQVEPEFRLSFFAIDCAGRIFVLAVSDDLDGLAVAFGLAEVESRSFGATRHRLMSSFTSERRIRRADPITTV